jgi:hypothetical protein
MKRQGSAAILFTLRFEGAASMLACKMQALSRPASEGGPYADKIRGG